MTEKLRYRITLISMLALSIVLTLMCISLSLFLRINYLSSTKNTLEYISENVHSFKGNRIPPDNTYEDFEEENFSEVIGFGSVINENTLRGSRFFAVFFNDEGEIYNCDISHISEISQEQAEKNALYIYKKENISGEFQNYRYLRSNGENGFSHIVFLDCTSSLRPLYFAQFMSIAISLFLIGAMTLIVWFFSKMAANPFLENLEAQKQFITNASHEIKTPLAIIDANAEVLKLTGGENEWIDSIQNQTKRLSNLVKRLMLLSKTEEISMEKLNFEKFSVSDAVLDTVAFYNVLAQQKNISIVSYISPDVFTKGDEASIRQLIEILLENAVKYCDEKGVIEISLKNKHKNLILDISNSCDDPPDKKSLDKIFDRFYRDDDSRSRNTGGYGIGLSIAKAIVDNHKGKISASADKDKVTFNVVI